MIQDAIMDIILISIPEQFIMALFVWVIIGCKGSVKFLNVVWVGLLSAIFFSVTRSLFESDLIVMALQFLIFYLLVMYFYRSNIFTSILASLLIFMIMLAIQGATVNILRSFAKIHKEEFLENVFIKSVCVIPEIVVVGFITAVLYIKNLGISKLKRENSVLYGGIRFLVLQLSFALLILSIIYTIFFKNIDAFVTVADKILLVSSYVVTIIFTTLVVKSVFEMCKNIQREEEHKRELDNRELIQNLEYLCKLIDLREYDELRKILESMSNGANLDIAVGKDGSGN